MKKETRSRSPRSKSPLRRSVRFSDKEKVIPPVPAGSGKEQLGMRMKEARDAVPRKEGETRQSWKNRIFNYKRAQEQQETAKKKDQ